MAWAKTSTLTPTKRQLAFLPVANGTHFNGAGAGGLAGLPQVRCRQTRKLLRVIAPGATQMQVEWANIFTLNGPQTNDASCEIPGPNSVTVRMSVEYPAGKIRQVGGSSAYSAVTAYALFDQVTYNGSAWVCIQAGTGQAPTAGSAYWRQVQRYTIRWAGDTDTAGTVVFTPGDYKKSLPVALTERMIAGDCVAILGAYDTGSATNRVPYAGANGASNHGNFVDWVVDSASGMPAIGASLPETGVVGHTNGNTTTAGAAAPDTWMKLPYATALTGDIPVQRCVALFGDSLIQGYGGDNRDGEPAGIFVRALDGVSWWRIAQGGQNARCYAPGNWPWQQSVVARCNSVVTDLALNDMMAGGTTAQLQTWMARLWRELNRCGIPVYTGLLTPISASSDAWATTANQTRFLGASGTLPTSQFPTDADYATTVYGAIAQWLSQDGASLTTPDGVTVKVGQPGHPLEQILDWRGMIADQATSWKWAPGFTADGAHPGSIAAVAQGAYLAPQLEGAIMGRQTPAASRFPPWSPVGDLTCKSMPRSAAAGQSAATSGSVMGVLDTAAGGYFYGLRAFRGAGATAGARAISVMMGMDPARLKVVASGTNSNGANLNVDIGLGVQPFYVPAGMLIAVQLQCLSANDWIGATVPNAGINKTGTQATLAGTSTDTAALAVGTIVNILTKWTAGVFRPFLEAY